MDDSLVEIQRKNFQNYSYGLKVVKNPETWDHKFSQSAIIFCQRIEFLKCLQQKSKLINQSHKDMKFLVVFGHEFFITNSTLSSSRNNSLKEIESFQNYKGSSKAHNLRQFMKYTIVQKSLNTNFGLIGQFQYFLIATKRNILLATIEWFSELTCNHYPVLRVINSLNKRTGNWIKKLENFKKFRNFYGCKLIYLHIDGKTKQDLLSASLFDILGQKGNFEAVHVYTDSDGDFHIGNVHLHLFSHMDPEATTTQHITSTFTSFTLEFYTTPGELYTSYEKLLMPFDKTTWCLLIVTFCLFYIIILFLNILPPCGHILINSKMIITLGLNLTGIFFGVPMRRLPLSSLLRYIFTLFLFFCLIFRTSYQGLLFELMTSDKHKQTPQTIDDLVDMNYTIYCENVFDYPDRWFTNKKK